MLRVVAVAGVLAVCLLGLGSVGLQESGRSVSLDQQARGLAARQAALERSAASRARVLDQREAGLNQVATDQGVREAALVNRTEELDRRAATIATEYAKYAGTNSCTLVVAGNNASVTYAGPDHQLHCDRLEANYPRYRFLRAQSAYLDSTTICRGTLSDGTRYTVADSGGYFYGSIFCDGLLRSA